ncbi:sentan isoform X2 [Microcaecilia unicolor]|uniref:Sentan isoform X2 n=1 Tax=Microcaecilia unicolor TaxID=1415580 RepID=A0A6P7YC01_9AMPH|nr:sentan isoform X2 [Microcaecilia unicolor]
MCGCKSSTQPVKEHTVNQADSTVTKESSTPAARNMPKSTVPIPKQLASVKALGKGSDLEKAFATAALVYNTYAGEDGKLSKAEAQDLFQTQFQNFIQGQETKPKYKEIISDLEENKDGKIDFEDFMILTLSLTLMSDLLQDIKKVKTTK